MGSDVVVCDDELNLWFTIPSSAKSNQTSFTNVICIINYIF